VIAHIDPGFGAYLRTEPALKVIYRAETGRALADMPRLVVSWRARSDAAARDRFSPAQVEAWLRRQHGTDDQDVADCRTYAKVWMAR
jgi:hypothetical protein